MPGLWTDVAHSIPLAGSADGDLSDIFPRLPGMKRASDVSQNASYPMLVWYLYECHGDRRLLKAAELSGHSPGCSESPACKHVLLDATLKQTYN